MRLTSRESRAKSDRRRGRRNAINGTVQPRLVPYIKRRQREYLTVKEVELLTVTARKCGAVRPS